MDMNPNVKIIALDRFSQYQLIGSDPSIDSKTIACSKPEMRHVEIIKTDGIDSTLPSRLTIVKATRAMQKERKKLASKRILETTYRSSDNFSGNPATAKGILRRARQISVVDKIKMMRRKALLGSLIEVSKM